MSAWLALTLCQQRIFAPIAQPNETTALEFNEFTDWKEVVLTIKGQRILGCVHLNHTDIRCALSDVREHALNELRTDTLALNDRINGQETEESRFLADDEADDRAVTRTNLRKRRFFQAITNRLRRVFVKQMCNSG